MRKDFDKWNAQKKKIHDRESSPFFHTREIWWCSLGVNVGFEQDGSGGEYRRPALILKGMSRQTCFVIPLTTSAKSHPLRPSVGIVDGKVAYALLSQIRIIDAKRLVRKIGLLDKSVFTHIQKTARDMIF